MAEEGDSEADNCSAVVSVQVGGVPVTSHPEKRGDDQSPSAAEERLNSTPVVGGPVSIDQVVRDFIIAKKIGLNPSSGDRIGDGTKTESDRKSRRKSSKDKKKKKKKKKHKSHRRESSSKRCRHRREDGGSSSDESEASQGDGRQTESAINAQSRIEDGKAEMAGITQTEETKAEGARVASNYNCEAVREHSDVNQGCVTSGRAKETTLIKNEEISSKDVHRSLEEGRQNVDSERDVVETATGTAQEFHSSKQPAKSTETKINDEQCGKSNDFYSDRSDNHTNGNHSIARSSSSLKRHEPSAFDHSSPTHSSATHRLREECTSSHKQFDQTLKLKEQDGISSKKRHYVDNNGTSDRSKKRCSSRERRKRGSTEKKSDSSRKRSSSVEKVTDMRAKERDKPDDVVFVKKVPAIDAFKSVSSREAEKLNRRSRQRLGAGDGSKHIQCDSDSSNDEISRPKSKPRKDGKSAKESPVILLSDDDADVLSEEMAEKLHQRLTMSLKKSKELQAERELSLKAGETTVSGRTGELSEDSVHLDAAVETKDDLSVADIALPDSEPATASEQTATKAASSVLVCKKPLKFGLKISETSAALISKGIKSNLDSGDHVTRTNDGQMESVQQSYSPENDHSSSVHENRADQTDGDRSEEPVLAEDTTLKAAPSKSSKTSEVHRVAEVKSGNKQLESEKRVSESRSKDRHRESTKESKHRSHSKEKKSDKKSRSRSRSRDHQCDSRKEKRPSRERSREQSKQHESKSRDSKRTKSPSRSRRRSRSTSRGPRRSRSRGRRSRSRSRRLRSQTRRRRRSRSRQSSKGKSRSRSPERSSHVAAAAAVRLNIDKEKLREIAIKNAYGNLPVGALSLPRPAAVTMPKTRGKSVKELTEFCKKIAEEPASKTADSDEDEPSGDNVKPADDETEQGVFLASTLKAATTAAIIMNIRNAKQLPVMTTQEKAAKTAVLRTQFPVSSGSDHRSKESDWVPVTPSDTVAGSTATTVDDKVFHEPPDNPKELETIVGERVSALRKLKNNPHDKQALSTIFKVQQQMKQWAEVETTPGQFMGSTGVQTLTPEELGTEDRRFQAWVKKDTFTRAAPLTGGIGKVLLERMGWKAGTGLGKNREGITVPLSVDIKTDRRGLMSCGETSRKAAVPASLPGDMAGKHPVSILNEMCSKRHWLAPKFELMEDVGPSHSKTFRFKVVLNNVEYQPGVGSSSKKIAKLEAAQLCLQQLGLMPNLPPRPLMH